MLMRGLTLESILERKLDSLAQETLLWLSVAGVKDLELATPSGSCKFFYKTGYDQHQNCYKVFCSLLIIVKIIFFHHLPIFPLAFRPPGLGSYSMRATASYSNVGIVKIMFFCDKIALINYNKPGPNLNMYYNS